MLEFLAEGKIALLDPNPGLLIWTIITFTLVMVVLRWKAWGPIAKALDDRAAKIHEDIDKAEAVRKEAEARLEEYMSKLNGLRAEGQEIITEAKRDAENLKNEVMAEARKEAEAIKTRGLKDVQLAMDKALETYQRQISELSVTIAGRIIDKSLSEKDHERLIGDSIKELQKIK